jgi:hypothetical protein
MCAVAKMQNYQREIGNTANKDERCELGGTKKRGLVIANLAIRSPVPRSALFLK